MAALPDVNVLVALAWPNHVHHLPAQQWFAAHHRQGWATCPLTESGFVRVSSNPRTTPEAKTAREALAILRRIVAMPGHEFWRDDTSLATGNSLAEERLLGHKQVTDAHLLSLVIGRGGRLVTFDRGVRELVPDEHRHECVVVLGA